MTLWGLAITLAGLSLFAMSLGGFAAGLAVALAAGLITYATDALKRADLASVDMRFDVRGRWNVRRVLGVRDEGAQIAEGHEGGAGAERIDVR